MKKVVASPTIFANRDLTAQVEQDQQNKKRLEFIDMVKGIGIILMVAYHCHFEILDDFRTMEILFMPMFFVVSGLFFRDKGHLWSFIENKVYKLLIPFLFFLFIGDAFYFGANRLGLLSVSLLDRPFYGFFFGDKLVNGPIWYLITLFNVCLIVSIVFKVTTNIINRVVVLVVLSIVGMLLSYYRVLLLAYLSQALFALPFFCYGYIINKYEVLNNSALRRLPSLIWIALLAVVVTLCQYCDLDLVFVGAYTSGNLLLVHVYALIVTLCMLFLCRKVGNVPIVTYIGRYSLIVLGLHWMVWTCCLSVLNMVFGSEELYYKWFVTLCVVTISMALIYPCIRWFPYFVAQKDLTPVVRRWYSRITGRLVRQTAD